MEATPRLPSWAANHLRTLYERGRDLGFASAGWELSSAYMIKLHEAGWSPSAIAEPLDLSAEAIRKRIKLGTSSWALKHPRLAKVPESPQPAPKDNHKRVRNYRPLTNAEYHRLQDLYVLARQTRGSSPLDAPERAASVELWKTINELLADTVAPSYIATALDVQIQTIWQGLRRHGHRKLPASQKPYRGIKGFRSKGEFLNSPRGVTCKRGHDNWGISTRTPIGQTYYYCRECNRMGKQGRDEWDEQHRNDKEQ